MSNPFADFFDPGNFFHDTDSDRLSKKQFNLEKEYAKKNYDEQVRMNDWNIKMQEEAYAYQLRLNQLQMEREDNAIERRVQDLKNSGLSPTLAAGSPASSTPVHAGTAPQGVAPQIETPSDVRVRQAMFKEQMQKDRIALAMSAMGNIADISRTKAETEMIKAKTGEQDVINKYVDEMISEKLSGQRIANDAGRLANSFNRLANPVRLNQMQKDLQIADKQLSILGFDEKIKTNEALRQIYYNTQARFVAELAGQNVELAKLRRENISIETACKAYALDYAVAHGVPLSGMNDWQAIFNIAKMVKDWLGTPDSGMPTEIKPGRTGGMALWEHLFE